MTIGIDRIFVS